jgi:plastocyanin
VKVGDVVTWINKDLVPHTATSRTGGFDSGAIDPGKSWKFTATRAGDFPYSCVFHPTMTALLRVK